MANVISPSGVTKCRLEYDHVTSSLSIVGICSEYKIKHSTFSWVTPGPLAAYPVQCDQRRALIFTRFSPIDTGNIGKKVFERSLFLLLLASIFVWKQEY
uniref:Uncharacterized protein n=1 Tax=Strigamia maritima TaxID=126957 RepID=T1INW9_STRMM